MTIDEFLSKSLECASMEELGNCFAQGVATAGFQNVSLVRFDPRIALDVSFLAMPEDFLTTYIEQNCILNDPVINRALSTVAPFLWNDLAATDKLSKAELNTLEVCRDVGVHSGLSIPFHGPDGKVDLIGVSLRDQRDFDPNAIGRVVTLASITRWRFWQLRNKGIHGQLPTNFPHTGGLPGMTAGHCRAMVLIDVSARRRQMGLEQFSRTLTAYVAEADLEFLLSWGYVVEHPDDSMFRYWYELSPLGARHIATCAYAIEQRRSVWDGDVPRHERPVAYSR